MTFTSTGGQTPQIIDTSVYDNGTSAAPIQFNLNNVAEYNNAMETARRLDDLTVKVADIYGKIDALCKELKFIKDDVINILYD